MLFLPAWTCWQTAHDIDFEPYAQLGWQPARVVAEFTDRYTLWTSDGECTATLSGKLRFAALGRQDLPAVGDWVAYQASPGIGLIQAVLPRHSCFSRRMAGGPGLQIVAANMDTVLIVQGLDGDFNLRRLERTLLQASASGAAPVVLLNKSDQHPEPQACLVAAQAVAGATPVVLLSALQGVGFSQLQPWLVPGQTLVLLGSSGVGKSTIINVLCGAERMATQANRSDDSKGRHTTTHRQLLPLASGAWLMDTPGMRELHLWGDYEDGFDTPFADLEALALRCRYRDCSHAQEPGCALQAALADGELAPERWRSWQKLMREQAYAARQEDAELDRQARARWKKISQSARQQSRQKYR
jgi:ribosome biogenesis GTPase